MFCTYLSNNEVKLTTFIGKPLNSGGITAATAEKSE